MSRTLKDGRNWAGTRLTIGCVGHLLTFEAILLGFITGCVSLELSCSTKDLHWHRFIRVNQKSCLPVESSLGSLAPMLGNLWLISLMASSTKQAQFSEATGRDASISPAEAKGLEDNYRVCHLQQEGVKISGRAKCHTDAPSSEGLSFLEGTTLALTVSLASSRSAGTSSWAAGGAASTIWPVGSKG